MNKNIIEYRPYPYSIYFIPFMTIEIIFTWVLIGGFIWSGNIKGIVSVGICSILLSYFTKCLYDSSKKMILFDESGLRIISDGTAIYTYVPWEEASYGYYHKDYKGNEYFLLSATPLERKKRKRILHRSTLSSKIYVSNVIVIYSSLAKDSSHIKEFFLRKILSIEEW